MAKEAVTPPVVGSVSRLMKGSRASSRRARAAEILAICMRESVPSIMRAPPEQETITSGSRSATARSTARVTFSPTTTPMEPPMKPYSMTAITVGMPSMGATAETRASQAARLLVAVLRAGPRRAWCRVKLQGVAAHQAGVELLPGRVAEQLQPLAGGDAEVERALGADAEVRQDLLAVDALLAGAALDVEPLGDAALLLVRREAPRARGGTRPRIGSYSAAASSSFSRSFSTPRILQAPS